METLVSVVLPSYNSAGFIREAIESVLCQTYPHWELLIVDDCSEDDTVSIAGEYASTDSRVKLFQTASNSGSAALPRNLAIRQAKGRYIAFLDSDDVWLPDKLTQQIGYFDGERVALVFSDYRRIAVTGEAESRCLKAPLLLTYRNLLKGNAIGCLTAVYDTETCGKMYFRETGHEDYALWLEILKKGYVARNTGNCQALYRVRPGSLSARKWKALSWTWNIYRKQEGFSRLKSAYYFIHYMVRALLKRSGDIVRRDREEIK